MSEIPDATRFRQVKHEPNLKLSDEWPALDRASIPAMFNVLAGEIRKLSEKVDANEKEASGRYDRLLILIGVTQDGIYERINLLATDNEKMQAQLSERFDKWESFDGHDKMLDRIALEIDRIAKRQANVESQMTALRAEADKGRTGLSDLCLAMSENVGELRDNFKQFYDRWQMDKILAGSRISSKTLGLGRKKKQERKRRAGK